MEKKNKKVNFEEFSKITKEELTIGDTVYYVPLKKVVKFIGWKALSVSVSVNSKRLTLKDDNGNYIQGDLSELSRVPVTREFFPKNGFVYNSAYGVHQHEEFVDLYDNIDKHFFPLFKDLDLYINKVGFDYYKKLEEIKINFNHEDYIKNSKFLIFNIMLSPKHLVEENYKGLLKQVEPSNFKNWVRTSNKEFIVRKFVVCFYKNYLGWSFQSIDDKKIDTEKGKEISFARLIDSGQNIVIVKDDLTPRELKKYIIENFINIFKEKLPTKYKHCQILYIN
jgi:hypothetical protein